MHTNKTKQEKKHAADAPQDAHRDDDEQAVTVQHDGRVFQQHAIHACDLHAAARNKRKLQAGPDPDLCARVEIPAKLNASMTDMNTSRSGQ